MYDNIILYNVTFIRRKISFMSCTFVSTSLSAINTFEICLNADNFHYILCTINVEQLEFSCSALFHAMIGFHFKYSVYQIECEYLGRWPQGLLLRLVSRFHHNIVSVVLHKQIMILQFIFLTNPHPIMLSGSAR